MVKLIKAGFIALVLALTPGSTDTDPDPGASMDYSLPNVEPASAP